MNLLARHPAFANETVSSPEHRDAVNPSESKMTRERSIKARRPGETRCALARSRRHFEHLSSEKGQPEDLALRPCEIPAGGLCRRDSRAGVGGSGAPVFLRWAQERERERGGGREEGQAFTSNSFSKDISIIERPFSGTGLWH